MYERFEIGKVLIIAPLRVARNTWPEEVEKWNHLHGLRYSVAVGPKKKRIQALKADADIYIINRENIPWLIEKSGLPFDYDMVVVDELSSFKNWQSKRYRALMKVRPKVERIVGLTGTPSPNGLMDLFSEYKLLDFGERLGKYINQYRLNYFRPDWTNGHVVYSYKLLPGAEDRIHERISDITISMKAVQYLDMPELISTEYRVYMDDKEQEKYEQMKTELVLQLPDGEVTAGNAGVLSMKLCQMANGAVYTDGGQVHVFHSRKLDALEDIIEASCGKSLLVAYSFRHDLERISERLDTLKVVYRKLDSDQSIQDWNAGKLQVGLLHPASAGHGLNLQSGGNTLVWYGLPWSLELYQQTVARLWRQGQKSRTVVIQHLITEGTVDGRIMNVLEYKEKTQNSLIEAVKAEVRL